MYGHNDIKWTSIHRGRIAQHSGRAADIIMTQRSYLYKSYRISLSRKLISYIRPNNEHHDNCQSTFLQRYSMTHFTVNVSHWVHQSLWNWDAFQIFFTMFHVMPDAQTYIHTYTHCYSWGYIALKVVHTKQITMIWSTGCSNGHKDFVNGSTQTHTLHKLSSIG